MPEEKFDLAKKISEITDPKALRVIEYLLRKVEVLEYRIAELEKNSSNSSKPPSSDIVKPQSEQRQPGVRKIGGQPRHSGVKHELISEELVDEFINVALERCPCCCGELLVNENKKKKIIQQYEFVSKPIKLNQYSSNSYSCKNCCKNYYPELPGTNIGVKLQSYIAYIKSTFGMSYSEIREQLKDVFGVKISRSTICNTVRRCNDALEHSHKELANTIKQEKSIHCDETSWRDAGNMWWSWLFTTNKIAYFRLADTRSSTVVESVLGLNFTGAITTDFYSSYRKFNFINHQFCLAHLVRDIKFLGTLPDTISVEFSKKLLVYFKRLFNYWHDKDSLQDRFTPKILRLKTQLKNFIYNIKLSGKAKTLQKRIVKHWNSLFRFIDNPLLFSPTNNLAERTIRFLTRIRSLTQGSRGTWGTTWIERSTSVVASCRKQHRSIFNFYLQTLLAANSNFSFPSLLPTS